VSLYNSCPQKASWAATSRVMSTGNTMRNLLQLSIKPAFKLSLVQTGESTPVDSYRLVSTWRLIGGGWRRFRGLPGGNRILPYFDDLEHNHQLTQNSQNTIHACFRSCPSSRLNITWLPDMQQWIFGVRYRTSNFTYLASGPGLRATALLYSSAASPKELSITPSDKLTPVPMELISTLTGKF